MYYKSAFKAMMATQMTNKYNVREVTLIFCNQYHMIAYGEESVLFRHRWRDD